MRISTDDPKLTAYALDEMDERERLEFERQLAFSPEMYAAVSDIRQTAALLRHEFVSENETLSTDPSRTAHRIVAFLGRRMWDAAAAVAACIVLVMMWQFWFPASSKPDSSYSNGALAVVDLENEPAFENLKRPAFDSIANVSYSSAELWRHPLVADSGTGLHLHTRPIHSWANENEHFNFGVGYQLEF